MIKSKIDARERALELVVPLVIELLKGGNTVDLTSMANETVEFLIGDAELPEFVSGVDDILEAVEIFKKQMSEFNKTDNGQMEFLLHAPQDRKLMTESEVENFKAILIERGYIDEGANIILGSGNNYKKSFDGFDLRLYINKRVGGYVVSSTMNVGEGVDAPRFSIADYDLDIDRIESAALKLYGCYCETINLDEGV